MINYQTITIDLQPDYREPVVQMYLSERDVGRPIQVNVLMQGQPYSFTAGTTVHIDLRKPSGHVVQVNGNYAVGSNVVLFNVVEQMAAEPGMCLTELSIVGDGQDPIGSKNWLTKVELSPLHAGDPSETWIEDLDELVQEAMEGHIDATLSIEGDAADAKAAGDAIAAAVEQIPAVDATLTVPGAAADAKKTGDELADLKSAINDLAEEIEGGGLSEAAKQALLDCFANVVWADDDGRTYYDALEDALYPDTGLVSISAVFDPGQNVIYTDTQLNELKAYLTVTGYYAGGAVKTIRAYTLFGTLTEGQSTVTVSFEGKTTTFTATVASALDRIAYDTLTYRDMFITNNFIKIGNFDDITISTELVTLPNGDTYRINNGSPVISQDACVTGDSSLKVSIESMSSQVNYKSTRMPESAKFLMAACVRVDEYTSGNVGMQVNVSNAGLSASMIGHTTKASTTNGFEEIVAVGSYTYDASTHPDANLNIFMGDYSRGYATGYIDACIATIVPSGMTLQEATQLYHNYIQMVKS